jgi:shikimate kinase
MIILLTGFMGCGKSTLRNTWLSQMAPGFPSFDFDEELFRQHAVFEDSLSQMIERVGWPVFRHWEAQLLSDVLLKEEGIFSLGGGSLTALALEKICENTHVRLIWINTPFDVCWQRISEDEDRPLVRRGEEEVRQLYESRLSLYSQSEFVLDEKAQQQPWSEIKKELLRVS